MFHNVFYILIFGWTLMVFGYLTVRLATASLRMLRWQRGEAILEKLVISPKASKYVRMDAQIDAVYAYDYRGTRYRGTQISIFDPIPFMNLGYGPLVLSRLNELFVNKQAIRIRINSRRPDQSVLIDMPVRGPLLFGVAMTLMSTGLLIFLYFDGATPLSTAIGFGSAFILFLLCMVSRTAFTFIAMAFASL